MSSFLLNDFEKVKALVSSNPTTFALATCCATLVIWLWLRNRNASGLPLPPGPKALPIFGNLFGFPIIGQWKAYARWGKELDSGIIHFGNVLGKHMIVINDFETAKELLNRRATIYSGRPIFIMVEEIIKAGHFFTMMQYGKGWKLRRSIFRELNPSSNFQPQMLRAVRSYMPLYLDDPENFMQHTRDLIGMMAMSVAYGLKALKKKDPYVTNAREAAVGLMLAQYPGRFLVESLPFLKYVPSWFPGAEFKVLGKKWRKNCEILVDLPFQKVKEDRENDLRILDSSLASRWLDKMKGEDIEQEFVIKQSIGNFFFGASDSTASIIHTFLLAMILNPEIQKRAQAEMDSVVSDGMLPDFGDEPSLPLLSAILKEAFRWQPVAPIGGPHLLQQDDVYGGYYLPANSVIVVNGWAIMHNEELYGPNVDDFNPDRFLKDGQLNPDVLDPASVGAFGWGRRACPGQPVARSMLWIVAATILKTMDVGPAYDENGNAIMPEVAYTSSIVSHPKPYKCTFKPRSEEAESVLRSAAEKYEV